MHLLEIYPNVTRGLDPSGKPAIGGIFYCSFTPLLTIVWSIDADKSQKDH